MITEFGIGHIIQESTNRQDSLSDLVSTELLKGSVSMSVMLVLKVYRGLGSVML